MSLAHRHGRDTDHRRVRRCITRHDGSCANVGRVTKTQAGKHVGTGPDSAADADVYIATDRRSRIDRDKVVERRVVADGAVDMQLDVTADANVGRHPAPGGDDAAWAYLGVPTDRCRWMNKRG